MTVTATNSEGTATDSMNLVWGCAAQNNPPEISEITFMGDHYTGLEYTFSAAASDPDGDTLTYSWSVSGGTLADTNTNPVKWTMPASAGSYEITVIVDDGNGGEAEKTETVEVIALPSISLSQIPGGGWIYDGLGASISLSAWIGDDIQDRTERGFLNFDISGLAGKEVVSAEMKFTQFALAGDPYSIIEKIRVEAVYWGTGHIEPGDYYIPGVLLGEYNIPTFTCSSIKLIDELNKAIDVGHDRFQIRLSHKGYLTNHNGSMDRIKYGGPSLPVAFNVTYIP